jgi:hypothetical protein
MPHSTVGPIEHFDIHEHIEVASASPWTLFRAAAKNQPMRLT